MKIEVYVTFAYGAHELQFKKQFKLEFAPFYGLVLFDFTKDYENTIRLENSDYCDTTIYYDVRKKYFEINVRNRWKRPVTDETIDHEIEKFNATGWKRKDTTDVPGLKELMHRIQTQGL